MSWVIGAGALLLISLLAWRMLYLNRLCAQVAPQTGIPNIDQVNLTGRIDGYVLLVDPPLAPPPRLATQGFFTIRLDLGAWRDRAPVLGVDAPKLAQHLDKLAAAEWGRLLWRSDDKLSFTVLLRPSAVADPDLVSVEVRPLPGGQSRVLYFGRSLSGKPDNGRNRRRARRWIAAVMSFGAAG